VGGFNSETFVDQEARFALKVTLKIRKPFSGNVLVDAFPTHTKAMLLAMPRQRGIVAFCVCPMTLSIASRR
jgi:hypothetical protein